MVTIFLLKMQNKQTLIDLGFIPKPNWDFHQNEYLGAKEFFVKHYFIENENGIFRAFENSFNGSPTYVQLGKVINEKGAVDRWRDCQSEGSVFRKINNQNFGKKI